MSHDGKQKLTIFLIEEDDETRPLLKQNLQRDGFRIIVAVNEEDAIERVAGGQFPANLVLVNLVGKPPEDALEIGRKVRERARYDGHTPLVVMAERYGEDLEGSDRNVGGNDWITYLEDHEQLRNLLYRLLQPLIDK
jgi:DNA-binding response OmpR family regulator